MLFCNKAQQREENDMICNKLKSPAAARLSYKIQWSKSDSSYVNCSWTFLAVLNFELNVLAFSQSFEAVTPIAEKCTNTSLLPSAGVMKPKPLDSLNHLT